jgi:hypothetical protein
LLLARDELRGWFGPFNAYKGGRGADEAHWLEYFHGRQSIIDRKNIDQPTLYVQRASVGIAGTIQPSTLAATMKNKGFFESGLMARLLLCMPPAIPSVWTDDDLSDHDYFLIDEVFQHLLRLEMAADNTPVDLSLSLDGKREWVKFYNEHHAEMDSMRGDQAAAWSKLEGYAARFALLFHLLKTPDGFGEVDGESIAAGVDLARWFGNEASRIYGIIGGKVGPAEVQQRRILLQIIRKHGGSITARELMRSSRYYSESTDVAEADLRKLVKDGLATIEADTHDGGRGAPVMVFSLVTGC